MTSRTSSSIDNRSTAGFIRRQRELFRRRLWPAALTFVSYLLYHVAGTATVLSNILQDLKASAGGRGFTAAERLSALGEGISGVMGYNSIFSWMLVPFLAAVLAIEGFAWMDNRREVDFYESQPVSRAKRFWDICVSSFLYFLFSYLITLEIGLVIAGAMGGLTRGIVIEAAVQTLRVIALFVCVYGLGVLSAMLTGNIIVAGLAFLVLMFYEFELKMILAGYCSEFLATYDGNKPGILVENIFTPLYHYSVGSTAECIGRLLALAALYFLLAFLCYRLRRNECAGTAVVFGPVRSVVRVATAVMAGLFIGLLLASIQNSTPLAVLWMVLFTLLTACIMQIIYDYDFRALFRHPLEIALSLIITLAVFLGFLFDIAGYDRFLPDPDKVEDAALICRNYDSPLYDEKGHYLDPVTFGNRYMHLKNVEDVIAIAELGQEYTRRRSEHNPFYHASSRDETASSGDGSTDTTGTSSVQTIDMGSYEILSENKPNQDFLFTAVYRMKNGKTISRQFSVPSSADPAMMDAVTGTQAFREGTFSICHDDIARSNAEFLTLDYTNGEESPGTLRLNKETYEAFRKAYLLDLEQFSYSFARSERPVGRICIRIQTGRTGPASGMPTPETRIGSQADRAGLQDPELENYEMNCEVYSSFSHTIAFLKDNAVWVDSLDHDTLPDYSDPNISREDRDRLDTMDWSVFNGLFSPEEY